MRSIIRWFRRDYTTHSDEARAQLAAASRLDRHADRLIEHERRLIRENHFGPKIAAALREGPR